MSRPTRQIWPTACALAMLMALVTTTEVVEAREPTDYEQYMLELVNRARANPNAEVARLSAEPWGAGGSAVPDLNEGPPTLGGEPWTIPSGPHQPLAFNLDIIDAAGDYAILLNDNDAFTHTYGGTTPESRMTAAGYTPGAYTGAYGYTEPSHYVPGRENLSWSASFPPTGIFDLTAEVDSAHTGLFIDAEVPSRGHRSTMMYGEWQETGVGISTGTDQVDGDTWDSVYIVHDFAHQAGDPFLTGVAFDDADLDNFYSPGEGRSGLGVEAYLAGTGTMVNSTTTFASGGYSLQLPAGSYDVRFFGQDIDQTFLGVDFTGGENVKLDGVNLVPEPGSLVLTFLGSLCLALWAWRRRR